METLYLYFGNIFTHYGILYKILPASSINETQKFNLIRHLYSTSNAISKYYNTYQNAQW